MNIYFKKFDIDINLYKQNLTDEALKLITHAIEVAGVKSQVLKRPAEIKSNTNDCNLRVPQRRAKGGA